RRSTDSHVTEQTERGLGRGAGSLPGRRGDGPDLSSGGGRTGTAARGAAGAGGGGPTGRTAPGDRGAAQGPASDPLPGQSAAKRVRDAEATTAGFSVRWNGSRGLAWFQRWRRLRWRGNRWRGNRWRRTGRRSARFGRGSARLKRRST